MQKVIEVENLVKKYGKLTAVDGLSFKVKKGEIIGFLGPNGSGKSTTINCLLSLLDYESGKIKIFGQEMEPDAYDIKRKIGVVFQDVAVFNELSVYENIDYFCGLYVSDKEKRRQYVEEAIDLVKIDEFRKFKPKKLSGGLLRRLNIACGIAHKPSLIIFDEPTVGVDPQSRNNILEGIKRLNNDGATIIYTTHYMEEAEQLCSRILIIDKGKLIADGTSEQLKEIVEIGDKIKMQIKKLPVESLEKIRNLQNVIEAVYTDKQLYVTFRNGENNLGSLIELLNKNDIVFDKVYSDRPSLNDVFLKLTGKELRD